MRATPMPSPRGTNRDLRFIKTSSMEGHGFKSGEVLAYDSLPFETYAAPAPDAPARRSAQDRATRAFKRAHAYDAFCKRFPTAAAVRVI